MARLLSSILLASSLVLFAGAACADTVVMDSNKQAQAEGVQVPQRGLTMDQVKTKFGDPGEIKPAVGDPPITRWVYSKFVVYFEHQYVIHSVYRH